MPLLASGEPIPLQCVPMVCCPHRHDQVYLVAGGYATNYQLASTELLVAGAHSWVEAAPLPLAVEGLRAVSINNMIISTGEKMVLSSLS